MSGGGDTPLEGLLDFLKRNRGFDFTGYKRSTLERRVSKRMAEVGIESHADYVDFLEVHPEEFALLFNTILINVTTFFRDPDAWEYLRTDVLPPVLDDLGDDGPLRVWSAGCASGEEAYTAAIVLCELLGEETYKARVKIYATDVDEEALEQARAAGYPAKQLEGVPDGLRAKYFDRQDTRYQFRSDLRRTVIFGRNDLVQDAPISRVDLLLCRNTLMYFNAGTQAQILGRFHFALKNEGVLFLGKSEMLITHSELFKPIDLRRRMFLRVPRTTLREARLRLPEALLANGDLDGDVPAVMRQQAFDRAAGAQIIVDASGLLVAANQEARALFQLGDADLGRPIQDLELSYRPVELRAHLDQLGEQREPIRLTDVRTTGRGGEERVYEVRFAPLGNGSEELLGSTIVFLDVTAQHTLQTELRQSKLELEQAYEELQSTVEELETTNEELQSTNEELETTNEELQSSNEELETMNEELQSTNEELETMNDELRQRSLELDEVNAFLETILTSMGMAVAVLDGSGVVQIWNSHAEDLWGLRSSEVHGQHFLGLDIGLPVEQLRTEIRAAIKGEERRAETVLDTVNRRGRPMRCHVTVMPLGPEAEPSGAILLMSEESA